MRACNNAARLLLRSQQARKVVLVSSDATLWQQASLDACY